MTDSLLSQTKETPTTRGYDLFRSITLSSLNEEAFRVNSKGLNEKVDLQLHAKAECLRISEECNSRIEHAYRRMPEKSTQDHVLVRLGRSEVDSEPAE